MTGRLLIDGDIVVYRSAFSAEKTLYLVEGSIAQYDKYDNYKEAKAATENRDAIIWSRKKIDPLDFALAVVDNTMRHLCDKYPNLERTVYLSAGVGNYRDLIATYAKYKGNRDAISKPVYFDDVQGYLKKKFKAETTTGQEADDALGIAATNTPSGVICSIDKDLLQIPGKHYNWVTGEEKEISVRDGALNFWTQVIAGDYSDNVPGLAGFGEGKARKALVEASSDATAWRIVLELYGTKYGKEEGLRRAVETARLVHIRRKEGEIWEPPTSKVVPQV